MNEEVTALFDRGAWLEPTDGKVAYRSRRVPDADQSAHWTRRYTRASLEELAECSTVAIIPASLGYVVLDIDNADLQAETETLLVEHGIDYGRARSQSGKYHVLIPWDDKNGEWTNGKLEIDGELLGDVRHAGGVVLIHDIDAWLETECKPSKPQAIRSALGTLGAHLKGQRAISGTRYAAKTETDFQREVEPLIAACLRPAYEIKDGDRQTCLMHAVSNQPLLAGHYAQVAAGKGLDTREIEKTLGPKIEWGRQRGKHLLRHADREWDPTSIAFATAQCPLPVGVHGKQWYRWSADGWQKADDADIIAWLRMWFFELADHGMLEPRPDGTRMVNPKDKLSNFGTLLKQLAYHRPITPNDDPLKVGLPDNKVLCLETGAIQAGRYSDYMVRRIAVVPAPGPHPVWDDLISGLPHEQREWVRAWIKYCLCGHMQHQYFVFAQGPAGTGKSTFAKTILRMLGDYGTASSADNFSKNASGRHPTWLVHLCNSRFGLVEEVRPGDFSPMLKSLASGDRISGRGMHQDEAELQPHCKLILTGNQRPTFPPGDGIKRRMALLEFDKRPERPDTQIDQKLGAELPHILHWAITATVGVTPLPQSVQDAVALYEQAIDHAGQGVLDHIVFTAGKKMTPAEIAQHLHMHDRTGRDKPYGESFITETMKRLGFKQGQTTRNGRSVPAFEVQPAGDRPGGGVEVNQQILAGLQASDTDG